MTIRYQGGTTTGTKYSVLGEEIFHLPWATLVNHLWTDIFRAVDLSCVVRTSPSRHQQEQHNNFSMMPSPRSNNVIIRLLE